MIINIHIRHKAILLHNQVNGLRVVDGELRAASGGKAKLDDLLLAMLDRRKHGLPLDKADWIEQVKAHFGEKGEKEFDDMLSGAVMLPEPQGFGPCFTRVTSRCAAIK